MIAIVDGGERDCWRRGGLIAIGDEGRGGG